MNAEYTLDEPIAAIATALAPAALGVVRVSGKDCIAQLAGMFSRPAALTSAASFGLVHGWLRVPATGTLVDEVLVSVFRAPQGFTGEEAAEVSCHGGVAVVQAVFRLLTTHGFRTALPGEFTFRAYINGKVDLTRAEAVKEIIDAKTAEAGERAAERLSGRLAAEINAIKDGLVTTLASIEAEIEYPEDENAVADAFDPTALRQSESRLAALVDAWAVDTLYRDGVRVVLAGKPNAGKSSIFNLLVKEERAMVSAVPGTTRDWIECAVSFGGIPARLYDTAGIRTSTDALEAEGVARTEGLVAASDVVLYVIDAALGADADDDAFLRRFDADTSTKGVVVWNKDDACHGDACHSEHAVKTDEESVSPHLRQVRFSALTGTGIAELSTAVQSVVFGGSTTPTNQSPARTTFGSARQKTVAEAALQAIRYALDATAEHFALDAVAQDIDEALGYLGEVTGEVTPEHILDTVFSHFCVGK